MSLDELRNASKAIGANQTVKAVEKGNAVKVYVAADAERRVTAPILDVCSRKGIAVCTVSTMQELGKACGIAVGAAAVAVKRA